ncbi:MAG: flagellar basal body-associated FliL family protein [Candidatus Muiribacteriota bacterium]
MAEEVKTGNPLIKYLIVAILGIVGIMLVTGISYFVSHLVYGAQQQISSDQVTLPIKAKYEMAEFLVPTSDNQGIIKVKVQLGVSDSEVVAAINDNIGLARDSINRLLVSKTAVEAIEDYRSGKLQEEIRIKLNEVLKHELGDGVFDGTFKEVVAVYFLEFLVQ